MSVEIPNDLSRELSEGVITQKQALILKEFKNSLEDIRDKLSRAYTEYAEQGTLSLEIMSKYGRLEKLEENAVKIVNDLLKKSDTHVKSAIRGVFKSTYYGDAYVLNEMTTGRFDFALIDTKKIDSLIDKNTFHKIKWPTRLKGHAMQMTQEIQSEMLQGVIQGKPYKKVSQNIADRMGVGAYKAHRIVRTEGHRSQEIAHKVNRNELSRNLEGQQSVVYKIWDATLDLRTRSLHRQLDGQKVKQGKKFEVAGLTTSGPGQFGIAKQDINCRCYTRTIVENPNFEFTEPSITYREWYKNKMGKNPAYNKRVELTDKEGVAVGKIDREGIDKKIGAKE